MVSDRQRNRLILLIVAGLIAASAIVISSRPTVLGLDLKGGIELVYRASGTPQHPQVTSTDLSDAVAVMGQRVDSLGVSEPSIQTEGNHLIDVQLPNVANVQQAERAVGDTSRLAFYDWEANVLVPQASSRHHASFAAAGITAQDANALRISQGGGSGPGADSVASGGLGLYPAVKLAAEQRAYVNPAVNSRKGSQYWLFGDPGSTACRALGAATGMRVARSVHCLLNGPVDALTPGQSAEQALDAGLSPTERRGAQIITVPQGWIVAEGSPASFAHPPRYGSESSSYYVLRDAAALFGNEITHPQETSGPSGQPAVSFGFTSSGAKAFAAVTQRIALRGSLASVGGQSLNEHFAAALVGNGNQLLSVAYVKAGSGGIDTTQGAQISGSFTVASAQALATQLSLGTLPVNLTQISDHAVSATLGAQALHQGLIAGLIGLGVVVLFLLLYYRLLGLIAVGGLIAYGVYFFALIKLIPITLTLAGIAGLVLTIGVAADANIVIFERIKEEIRAGRSIRNGIIEGYKKGLSAIIDANVVTIMTAFILFVLATQDVKGFAFTLGIGTFVSLFTAVMATQAILLTLGNTSTLASPSALGARGQHRGWSFDFMGASRYFFTLSGVILLIGAFAIGGRGLNLGIDFTSGTQVSVGLQHASGVDQVTSVLTRLGDGDATVQQVHHDTALGPHGFQIASKYLNATQLTRLNSQLEARFGIRTSPTGNQDFNPNSVGPTFGSSVEHSAIVAIIVSLLLISVYITLRFDWKYAVPVLIALAHDLLISIGVYALTGRVVTTDTVAALLTILGYSMYDTIIVFDRVRENTKRMPNAAYSQIVNRSMSEVLTRSLATTACTLIPVVALLIFGGTTLKDFAFALLVGVASGAYSSIFIASPVLTHWKEREHNYRLRRERIVAETGYVPAYAIEATRDASSDVRRRRSPELRRRH